MREDFYQLVSLLNVKVNGYSLDEDQIDSLGDLMNIGYDECYDDYSWRWVEESDDVDLGLLSEVEDVVLRATDILNIKVT